MWDRKTPTADPADTDRPGTQSAGLRELFNCELSIDACGAKVKKIDFCGVSGPDVGSVCGEVGVAESRLWLLTNDFGKNTKDGVKRSRSGHLIFPIQSLVPFAESKSKVRHISYG